ncbi:MAG: hypothetical protein PHZ03_08480 [Syntrophomonas sp.]|nr:hypothetical protein [Syntrophomonas sp.]
MEFKFSRRFKREFARLPETSKKAFEKQASLLIGQPYPPFHPSLRIKKIKGRDGIFECTVTMGTRMTWEYEGNYIKLRNIGEHEATLKNP